MEIDIHIRSETLDSVIKLSILSKMFKNQTQFEESGAFEQFISLRNIYYFLHYPFISSDGARCWCNDILCPAECAVQQRHCTGHLPAVLQHSMLL